MFIRLWLIIFVAISVLIAQDRTGILATPKTVLDAEENHDVTAVNAFIAVLRATGKTGGVEHISCNGIVPLVTVRAHSKPEVVLDDVVGADHHWIVETGQARSLNLRYRNSSFLDVKIDSIEISDLSNPLRIANRVLNLPSVEERLHSARLENHTELGISSIPKTGAASTKQPEPIILRDMTVRDILNFVAASSGAQAWIYNERRCDTAGTFRIGFISK